MTDRASPLLVLMSTLLVAIQVAAGEVGDSSAREPEALLQEGVEAFNEGELEQARDLLEQARSAGASGTTLRYNLGVVYYRLGDYGASEAEFKQLLDTPHRALALFNLGLVAQADDREEEALVFFKASLNETDEDGLRRLARSKIEGLAGEAEDESPERSVNGVISLSAGYEDNLSQRPNEAPSLLSDGFSDLFVGLRGRPLQRDSAEVVNALEVQGTLYRRHYHDEGDFSSDLGRLGLYWIRDRGRQKQAIGLQQAYLRFGGSSREWQTTLDLRHRFDECFGAGASRCQLRFRATQVTPYSGSEPVRGQRYRLDASYQKRQSNWQGRLSYRAEYNDRRDLELPEDREAGEEPLFFFSYSPIRHGLSFRTRYLGFGAVRPGATLAYRYSDYPDPFRLPESGRRIDHRYQGTLSADWRVNPAFSVVGQGRYIRNESTLDRFDYRNYVAQLSVRYQF